ncbi:hypothetical protein ACVILK_002514 [Bradyrhizobium embrapense]
MSAKSIEQLNGTEVLIPLSKLKKSPKNARKTTHSDAAIEALAVSIAAKGMLQNLVVEPEVDGEGAATGIICVTIGEGRRLAQLLRVKRKEIRKNEPIRCIVDTANDPHEISVHERLPFDPDASTIRRLLTETHVAATDRRAHFVGLEAYTEAGGTVLRDLFTEDGGGYLEDVLLLDLLVTARRVMDRPSASSRRSERGPQARRLGC